MMVFFYEGGIKHMMYRMTSKTGKILYARTRKAMIEIKMTAWIFTEIKRVSDIQVETGYPIFDSSDEFLKSENLYLKHSKPLLAKHWERELQYDNPHNEIKCSPMYAKNIKKNRERGNFYPKNLGVNYIYNNGGYSHYRGFCSCSRGYHYPRFEKRADEILNAVDEK